MPWTITISLDEGRDDQGLISAVWDAGDGKTFSFSRRSLVDEKSQAAFLTAAEAARIKEFGKRSKEETMSSAITATANKAVK